MAVIRDGSGMSKGEMLREEPLGLGWSYEQADPERFLNQEVKQIPQMVSGSSKIDKVVTI